MEILSAIGIIVVSLFFIGLALDYFIWVFCMSSPETTEKNIDYYLNRTRVCLIAYSIGCESQDQLKGAALELEERNADWIAWRTVGKEIISDYRRKISSRRLCLPQTDTEYLVHKLEWWWEWRTRRGSRPPRKRGGGNGGVKIPVKSF